VAAAAGKFPLAVRLENTGGTYQTKPFRPCVKKEKMKVRFIKTVKGSFFWAMAILLAAILCGVPLMTGVIRADAPPSVHRFCGTVRTVDGTLAPEGVAVTAWINGEQAGDAITIDSNGQFGGDPVGGVAEWMYVVGQNGEFVVFKVGGVAAYLTSVGTIVGNPPESWNWQTPTRPEAIVFAGETDNGLQLVYDSNGPWDTTPPAAVDDLFAFEATYDTVRLRWMAPGDNATTGRAIYYQVRYNTGTITADNWSSSTLVSGAPVPKAAGDNETLSVSGLGPNTAYYFAVRTYDEIPNASGLSNCVGIQTAASVPGSWHRFTGTVKTTTGNPAAYVRVSTWVNGLLTHTLATDGQGNLGQYGLTYLEAHGQDGDAVSFKVEGIEAQVVQTWRYNGATGEWDIQTEPITIDNTEINKVELVYDSPDDTPPTVTVNSPNAAGLKFKIGSQHDITWTATDDVDVTSVDISYSVDNGLNYSPIISGTNDDGTHTWTIPAIKSTQCLVKVVAFDAAGNPGPDTSDNVFRLYLPGDADNNYIIQAADLAATAQIILEEVTAPAPSLGRDADATEDGVIDIRDITMIEHLIPVP
jgi:hypothetical protein